MTTRPPPLPAANRPTSWAMPGEIESPGEVVREVTEVVDDEELAEEEAESGGLWHFLYGISSFAVSMLFHLAAMLVLAYLTVPPPVRPEQTLVEASFSPLIEDEPVEVELEKDVRLMSDPSLALFSAAPEVGAAGDLQGSAGPPQLDARVLEQADAETQVEELNVEFPLARRRRSSDWSKPCRTANSKAIRGPSSIITSRRWTASPKS